MPAFTVEFGKSGAPSEADGRLDGAAFHRNHEPIWTAIGSFLRGQTGDLLELGSGTGQHAATYAGRVPQLTWWPSDINASHLDSIAAWRRHAGHPSLRAPQRIDLTDPAWRWSADGAAGGPLAAMLCINVLHIAPWSVSQNLIAGAARYLRADGRLFVYGPFMRDGAHTAPSNAEFDAALRAQDGTWGVRDTRDLGALAAGAGLALIDVLPMPSNNLVLAFAPAPGHTRPDPR